MYCLGKDIKTLFHSKAAALLLLALLGFALSALWIQPEEAEEEPPFSLGIVDLEQDAYSALLIDNFQNSDAFSSYVALYVGSEEETAAKFASGELDAWLKIPEDFVPRMIAIDHVPVEVNISLEDPSKAVILENLLSSYSSYITAVETGCMALYRQMEEDGFEDAEIGAANVEISMDLIMTALGRTKLFHFEEVDGGGAVPLLFYYACSLLGILPFVFAAWCGMGCLREKGQGILARLSATAGGLVAWRVSKILVYGGMAALVDSFFYLLVLSRMGRVAGVGVFAWIAVSCFGSAALGVLLSACFSGRREFLMAAGMGILILAVAGAAFLPPEYLPEGFVRLADWMPNRFLAGKLLG